MNRLTLDNSETRTQNTIHAAAMAALGFPVRVASKHRLETGEDQAALLIGEHSKDSPESSACGLLAALESGKMAKGEPRHPLLAGITALRNRSALLSMFKGNSFRLSLEFEGGFFRLIPSPLVEPPHTIAGPATNDISVVSALLTCGVSVVAWDGGQGQRRITLSPFGEIQGDTMLLTESVLQRLQTGDFQSADPMHPINVGIRACTAYKQLVEIINKPRTGLCVTLPSIAPTCFADLPSTATGSDIDDAYRFIKSRNL